MTATLDAEIRARLDRLNPAERRLAEIRLQRIITRKKAVRRFPTPGHLAKFVQPDTVQTQLMVELDKVALACDAGMARQWLISTPPQEGKSTRMGIVVPLWFLIRNPVRRIVIASYEQGLSGRSGLAVRQLIETHGGGYRGDRRSMNQEDELGLILDPDRAQQTNWNLADVPGRRNGGMVAVGVGSAFTGRSADILIIDDPVKDAKAADSAEQRASIQNWYQAVARTRLSGNAIVIVIQCMTGDTPVLMGDGREKPLRDVRPGDTVATYENGALTTSTVRNWANQGPDDVYSIRMASGRTVRANGRHPFMVVSEDGAETWVRLESLQAGMRVRSAEGPTPASGVPQAAAIGQPSARACACRTTAEPGMRRGTDLLRPATRGDARSGSKVDTGSPLTTTVACLPSRVTAVPSAEEALGRLTSPSIGPRFSASITITTLGAFEDCSATTATLSSDGHTPPTFFARPLPTWSVGVDEVVEIVRDGQEDVFDIEVERSHNFIANGLCVSNTRWHEDDLMGFLLREDDLLATPRWSRLIVPAVAEHHDPLGRQPGEYLISARGRTPEDWEQIRRDVGERWWAALYLCKPSPPAGGVFQLEWITNNRVRDAPELERTEVFVDPADNEGQGDEAGVIVAARGMDQRYYVLEDASDHMTVGRWLRVAFLKALRWGATAVRYEQSLSGLDRQARQAWKDLRREARKLDALWAEAALPGMGWPPAPTGVLLSQAVADLARDDTTAQERTKLEHDLAELWPHVPAALALPVTGIPVRGFPARGSKTFRAQMVSPLYSGNHVSHVGHHPELEHQMVAWQEGQDSPDRMDANVHALTELSRSGGPPELSGATGTISTRTTASTIPRLGMQGRH